MNTYFVIVQLACGKNANLANHTGKVCIIAADEASAGAQAMVKTGGIGVRSITQLTPNVAFVVSSI